MHDSSIPDRPRTLETLIVAAAVIALLVALAGLFWPGGEGAYSITTYRGQTEEIFGEGIYRDSSTFAAAGARGSDLVTLIIGLSLLATGLGMWRRGSTRGGLLLAGALTWLLYCYGSMALGTVAYNDLFLAYVSLFGASLWALFLLLATILPKTPNLQLSDAPRRGPGIFLIASGIVTAMIWLVEPVASLFSGDPPASLTINSTLLTTALDIGVIAPATVIIGSLILRRQAMGYILAVPVLVLEAMLAPMIAAQTVFQLRAGIEFSPGEILGPIGGFVVLATVAVVVLVRILRHFEPHHAPSHPPESARHTGLTPSVR